MATRRRFLQAAGGLAGAISAGRVARAERAFDSSPNLPRPPNIIVLMTDQERHHARRSGGCGRKLNCFDTLPTISDIKPML
jgi:hypothetical protein